jgi:molybdate transport system substrate-binding protein
MAARLAQLVAVLIAVSFGTPAFAQQKTVTVFAAASLKNALDGINAAYTRRFGVKVVASYAASSTLVRQIEQGAPADVLVSADLEWMDYAADRKLIVAATRINLLGNRLVLIAAQDSAMDRVAIGQGFDLARRAGEGRIATGDVKSVPAGKYAKAALQQLGAWDAASPKLAMADNVRAALMLVARSEASLGIVYETDAKVERGVKIIGHFPADSHPAIVYPVAALADARPEAADYLAFLRSHEARTVFEKFGFTVLVQPVS